jgi:hypothetical protein
MAIVQGKNGQRAVDYPSDLAKKEPGVVAAMAMKRDKHKKKQQPKGKDNHSEAAARRLANLNKGKSSGTNPYQ